MPEKQVRVAVRKMLESAHFDAATEKLVLAGEFTAVQYGLSPDDEGVFLDLYFKALMEHPDKLKALQRSLIRLLDEKYAAKPET